MIKNSTASALLLSGFLFAGEALLAQNAQNNVAQNPQPGQQNGSPIDQESIDQEIAMLRSNLRANRKQVIADNMKLTDSEAEKFWPIYDQYVNELVNINNAKYALIKEYVQNTNMTEEEADSLTKKWLAVDESVVQLRLKYIPIFRRGLSAKRTALFFQIDRRVQMLIDLQLASLLPLMQP
jgi:Spy/CpxP family protein refolding chaperone